MAKKSKKASKTLSRKSTHHRTFSDGHIIFILLSTLALFLFALRIFRPY